MASQGTPANIASFGVPIPDSNATAALHYKVAGHRNVMNRVAAPFIKKALYALPEDPLPEFPLQWIGEYLINQSLIYERNNDSTKIKERFRYNVSDAHLAFGPATNGTTQAARNGDTDTAMIGITDIILPPAVNDAAAGTPVSAEMHTLTPPQNESLEVPTVEIHTNGHVPTADQTAALAGIDNERVNGEGGDAEMAGTT